VYLGHGARNGISKKRTRPLRIGASLARYLADCAAEISRPDLVASECATPPHLGNLGRQPHCGICCVRGTKKVKYPAFRMESMESSILGANITNITNVMAQYIPVEGATRWTQTTRELPHEG
jgi:hypothetical protein